MNENTIKQRIQLWIVIISIALLVGKFVAFWLTNSIGVFTDAMESIVNVAAGIISFFSLRWAARPSDRQHPFGHGKVELISASVEGILIALAGGFIIYEGVNRIFIETIVQKLDIGIMVVAAAGLVNYIMGAYSIKMGRKYDSIALVAGGRHLQSDTYSTIGLVAGLILLRVTELHWIDGALAIIFGAIIFFTGASIIRKTVANLLDRADDVLIANFVEQVNKKRQPDWIDIHNTKILKYGSYLFIDCDLMLPWYYNIVQSHDACDALKAALAPSYGNKLQLSIHSDPCNTSHCQRCAVPNCPHRKSEFTEQYPITADNIILTDQQRNEI